MKRKKERHTWILLKHAEFIKTLCEFCKLCSMSTHFLEFTAACFGHFNFASSVADRGDLCLIVLFYFCKLCSMSKHF